MGSPSIRMKSASRPVLISPYLSWRLQSTAQLKRLNQDLELRIDERTREREQALAQLFEAQKMDAIGQLTGGVAHDFNNLLTAVMGSLELLNKRLPDDPRMKRLVDAAQLGELQMSLDVRNGRAVAEVCRAVRGVVLSRQAVPIGEWAATLAGALVSYAEQNAQAAQALRKLVAGS